MRCLIAFYGRLTKSIRNVVRLGLVPIQVGSVTSLGGGHGFHKEAALNDRNRTLLLTLHPPTLEWHAVMNELLHHRKVDAIVLDQPIDNSSTF